MVVRVKLEARDPCMLFNFRCDAHAEWEIKYVRHLVFVVSARLLHKVAWY